MSVRVLVGSVGALILNCACASRLGTVIRSIPVAALLLPGMYSASQAVPLLYDETITITDSQRAINIISHGGIGINPFVFLFANTPVPIDSTINITVFGRGDFDGLEDGGPFGAGFQETLSASMESVGLALDGDTKLGPFAGSREFSLSGNFGWSTFTFADGLTGTIFLAQGVSDNISTDFLAMRVRYSYEGLVMPAPEPAALALFGLGIAGLGFAAWRRKSA